MKRDEDFKKMIRDAVKTVQARYRGEEDGE